MIAGFTSLMPLWALLGAVAAFIEPVPFAALEGLIVPLLGVVMFGMGMTLTAADFARVLERPSAVGLGVALQYLYRRRLAATRCKDVRVSSTAGSLPPTVAAIRLR